MREAPTDKPCDKRVHTVSITGSDNCTRTTPAGLQPWQRYMWETNLPLDSFRVKLPVEKTAADRWENPLVAKYKSLYDTADEGHRHAHVEEVADKAKELAGQVGYKDLDLVEAAGLLHDVGSAQDRDNHERVGADMIRGDTAIAQSLGARRHAMLIRAILNHRASTGRPTSTLARIISDADRIGSGTASGHLQRAIQYGQHHEPDLSDEQQKLRALEHQIKKYGPEGKGYTSLNLDASRAVIAKMYRELVPIQAMKTDAERVKAIDQVLGKTAKYDPPLPLTELIEKYPKLADDPVHRWRAEQGIELVHEEPTMAEIKRIITNWYALSPEQQKLSDKKSVELFGRTNKDTIQALLGEKTAGQDKQKIAPISAKIPAKVPVLPQISPILPSKAPVLPANQGFSPIAKQFLMKHLVGMEGGHLYPELDPNGKQTNIVAGIRVDGDDARRFAQANNINYSRYSKTRPMPAALADKLLSATLDSHAKTVSRSTPNFATLPPEAQRLAVRMLWKLGPGMYPLSSTNQHLSTKNYSALYNELTKHKLSTEASWIKDLATRKQAPAVH